MPRVSIVRASAQEFPSLPHRPRRFRLPAIGALAVLTAGSLWSPPAAAAPCFHYGEVVTLTGDYYALAAPPADGIVRRPATDAARRADLLVVGAPFCVEADMVSTAVPDALTIQLNCPAVTVADGSVVSLTGRLRGARTGNGQTPVLLSCQQ